MKTYPYFPGCSLKVTGKAYEESLLSSFRALDVEFKEVEDWNCCGATAYMATDEVQALALAGRNLAIAEQNGGQDLIAPCAACYLVLNKTKKALADNVALRGQVTRAMEKAGLQYKGKINVRHPLEILINDIGVDTIKTKVKAPLKGLKVAPYYGCQIVRPYALFDDQHNPTSMDKVIQALGAEVVDYPYKTRCCGGSQTGTMPDVGLHLVYMLMKEAKDRGADVISVVCPLCQFNLDGYQDKVKKVYGLDSIPIVYITQLMGWAFGLDKKKTAMHRGIVPVLPVMNRRTANVEQR
jgi:heterodisulfide reductase subunit B2